MKNKFFIITVDTECDNQWDTNALQETKNAYFIPRFQELCEAFDFYPVYLVDYVMANNQFLCNYLKQKRDEKKCEIGMHLHAWNTPPFCDLDSKKGFGRPFLIEYPRDIMESKIKNLKELLHIKFGDSVFSHRAGRWMIDETYIELLEEFGILIDCSITPSINWKSTRGAYRKGQNYSRFKPVPFYPKDSKLLEVPMTIEKARVYKNESEKSFLKRIIKQLYFFFFGKKIWVRLSSQTIDETIKAIRVSEKRKRQYIEFMIHSSELMPGGSPYYKTEADIDNLYIKLNELFSFLRKKNYFGITLSDFKKQYDSDR